VSNIVQKLISVLFLSLVVLVAGIAPGALAQTRLSPELSRLVRDPELANDPTFDSDTRARVVKEAETGFAGFLGPALKEIAGAVGDSAGFTFERGARDIPISDTTATLAQIDGQWSWEFRTEINSIELEENVFALFRGDAAFKFWAQIVRNPPPNWVEEEIARYSPREGEFAVTVGQSDRGVLETYDDSSDSQIVSVIWMRGAQVPYVMQIRVLAPDGADRREFALSVARKVDAILERNGFYSFPEEFDWNKKMSLDITLLDANPKFSKDGETRPEDRKPSDLIIAETKRIGTIADGVSQLILRLELDEDKPVTFALSGTDDGTITPLLDGRTVRFWSKYYAFALYTPPDQFSPPLDAANSPDSPLAPPENRLGDILETRNVPVTVTIGDSGSGSGTLTLARPPVVLVHGLFSDPIQTWINTFEDGASMAALLERAGFLPFLVNYQKTNGTENTDEGFMGAAVTLDSSFQANRRVVWDSPLVDYTPVNYEYGFFEEEPILSELQKPAGTRIGGIKQALTYYRDDLNLAATQAIVIGHSMGGILARVWASEAYNPDYRRPENYMQGDIDRLLTLNTPHFGSELIELKDALAKAQIAGEDWLAWGRRQIANTALWWFLDPERGAVSDLRPGSRALRRIGPTVVPSYAISTTFSAAQTGAAKNDPYRLYEAIYAFAGAVFFNNRPLLDDFVTSRFIRWRNTAEGFQESGDWRGQDKLSLTDAENLQRYRAIVARNIDTNVYYWAARREADYQDELRRSLRNAIIAPYGMFETSMGNDGELDLLSLRSLSSNALTGADVSRFFDDSKENDVPNSFLTILRDLVFHNDPKTDGAVREVSQAGGLVATENIDGVVHSYSPWDYRVQRRVLFLLKSEIAAFDPAGFPKAGQLTPRYMPSRQLSDPQVTGDEAIAWSGMVPSHAREYLRVADQNDAFIMVRPVNPSSTGLLAGNAAAKGMNVKGKSSNWGPQIGYIPYDQRFSKLWRVVRDPARRQLQISEYNEKTEESVTTAHPEIAGRKYAVQRALTDVQSVNGPCDVVTDPEIDDAEEAVFLHCSGAFFRWQNGDLGGKPAFNPAGPLTDANLSEEQKTRVLANPMKVLADDTSDLEPRPYLTADYDLMAIGYRFDGDLCANGQTPAPGETVACTPGPTSGVRSASFDPLRGFISPRQMELLAAMNGAVAENTGYEGGLVTHHGPENQYPKSPYVDYPVLVFDPADPDDKTDGVAYLVRQGPPGFRDIHLKRLFTEKNRLGYNLWPNPTSRAWRWEERRAFDLTRGYDPRDVADLPPYVEEAPRPDRRAAVSTRVDAGETDSKDTQVAAKDVEPEISETPPKPESESKVSETQPKPEPESEVTEAQPQSDPKEPLRIEPEKEYDFEVMMYFNLANSGNAQAQFVLGMMYEYGDRVPQDEDKAARLYRFAADQGLAEGRTQLGYFYQQGLGVPEDDQRARDLFLLAAAQGDSEAQFALGLMYYDGLDADQDLEAAFKWFSIAAGQGHDTAQYYLGEIYDQGQVVPRDFPAALQNFTRAAKSGSAAAQSRLGQIYQSGKDVETDLSKAQTYFEQASEQGNVEAMFGLAQIYEEFERISYGGMQEGRPLTDLAINMYRRAAEYGHAEAQYVLGRNYDYARGVARDYAEARDWYEMAARQGHAAAQTDLGLLYELGQGGKADPQEAVRWYRRSAEQGYARGQYNLATMYDYGIGIGEDFEAASKWYKRAADQGNAAAQNNLGILYELGQGVPRDTDISASLYRQAAEQGHRNGQYNLGRMYDSGISVAQDYEQAAKWYRRAAEQGYRFSQAKLGVLYERGLGVEQDYAEAAKWYRLAAEQGHAEAQDLLGILYARGWGVVRDYTTAAGLFRDASDQGFVRAHYHLGQAYLLGKGVKQSDMQALVHWNIAASLGDSTAILGRYSLKSKLGPGAVDQARRLAREWLGANGQ
jgi:TPR repeat protein